MSEARLARATVADTMTADNNRPRTLEEVSQEIGRTRERVRQIQNQALSKLKLLLSDEADFTTD